MTSPAVIGDPLDIPSVEWTLYSAVTRNGRIIAELPFVGVPRWTAALNAAGTIEVTIPVHQDMISRSDLRQAITPWRYSLVLVAGDFVVQAGPIITYGYDEDSATVSVSARGLWAMQESRMLLPADTYGQGTSVTDPAADTRLGPLSLRTIIKRLVQQGETRTAGDLPIVYEPDVPGTSERHYPGYDLANIGERLLDLTQLQNGPDIEFRPRLTGDRDGVEWVLRTGNPWLTQAGDVHVWDYGEGLMSLSGDVDGSKMINSVFVAGQGMERGRLVGHRTVDPDPAWPLLEAVITEHSSVTERTTLDSYALSYLAMRQLPVEVMSARARSSGPPSLGTFLPGDDGMFTLVNHFWKPDGDYPLRVLGMGSGQSLNDIALTLAPTQGGL